MRDMVEIGMGRTARRTYELGDINIVPSRRTRSSQDVSTAWQLDAYRFEIPVLAHPTDALVSPEFAIELGRLGGLGILNGEGLIGRKTIELMTQNHQPGKSDLATMSKSLFSETTNAGTGFGLGFAITEDVAKSMIPGSKGEYYWGGMFSTAFFVDPVERVTMVFMTQLSPSNTYPIRRELKTMIYAALT